MEGCIDLEEIHFDPLPFLAQDCKACLCSSWLILRCQESVEVKNAKGGWEETFLCLWTGFDLEQMLCQRETESPPCAGTISRLHKVLKFQPLQSTVQLCSLGKEAPNVSLHSSGMFRTCPCLPTSVTEHGDNDRPKLGHCPCCPGSPAGILGGSSPPEHWVTAQKLVNNSV